MRAPNPIQQFKMWRDFGGSPPGPLNMFRWNEFTGERRAAYINHMTVGAIESLCFGLAYVALTLLGIVNIRIYVGFFITFVLVGVVHLITMIIRRETYMQLKWRELQAGKEKSQANFNELKDYADRIQKGYIK